MKNCERGLEIYLFIYKLAYKWVYATLSLNWPGLRAFYDPS